MWKWSVEERLQSKISVFSVINTHEVSRRPRICTINYSFYKVGLELKREFLDKWIKRRRILFTPENPEIFSVCSFVLGKKICGRLIVLQVKRTDAKSKTRTPGNKWKNLRNSWEWKRPKGTARQLPVKSILKELVSHEMSP